MHCCGLWALQIFFHVRVKLDALLRLMGLTNLFSRRYNMSNQKLRLPRLTREVCLPNKGKA